MVRRMTLVYSFLPALMARPMTLYYELNPKLNPKLNHSTNLTGADGKANHAVQ